jgi:hypothetical protein
MGRRADFHNEREPGLLGIQPWHGLGRCLGGRYHPGRHALRQRGLCEIIVPVGNSHSYMLVVQPAQNWHGQRATDGLDGAVDWRVFLQ